MTHIDALKQLPLAERIQLVEDLWDSIAGEPSAMDFTSGQKAELDRRLARSEQAPDEGIEWQTLKSRLQKSL